MILRVYVFHHALLAWLFAILSQVVCTGQVTVAIDIEKVPFEYSTTADDNRVSHLIDRLSAKEIKLAYTREHGYLRSLLRALEIPESSQTLVFSKTSMQVRYISRRNPRAIYFNDDTYLGWVHGSSLIEISTWDPRLGAAFYTVDMMPWRPKMQRAYYDCLACHATSMTQGIPGHTMRSVQPLVDGRVDIQKPSFITSDSSPFSQRWGGWYVTGMHGQMQHMGNAFLLGGELNTYNNGNRATLDDEFNTSNYLSPHSDIVALMVLNHQTQMHNTMARADFSVRKLLHDNQKLESGIESQHEWQQQLRMLAKEVLDGLLFCKETRLPTEVKGSSEFVDQFSRRDPEDGFGRSLRQFDLKTRLFKYPCSYLIYSSAFDALSPCLREEINRQLEDVLSGANQSDDYNHLSATTRADILAILKATKPDVRSNL